VVSPDPPAGHARGRGPGRSSSAATPRYQGSRRTGRSAPLPVRDLRGRFTVTDSASGTALVTLDTDIDPADPATADDLTTMIKEAFGQSFAALRCWIETRQRWDTA